jgi:hypothetical protein
VILGTRDGAGWLGDPCAPTRSCTGRTLTLKLNVAFLRDRRLLNRDHLTLHLRQFGSRLLVATDKEGCRPEDDDRGRRGDAVFGALTILRAGQSAINGGLRFVNPPYELPAKR